MPDLPADEKERPQNKSVKIQVTPENAGPLTIHYLSQIYGRLGYIIKLLEEKPRG